MSGTEALHIAFVTGEYPPMQGGVGAYTSELGAALAKLGVEVSVITSVQAKQASALPEHDVMVYPVMARWGWAIAYQVPILARAMGANWLHVQYQTAAYGMHPAINISPWWWRRADLQVAWTYHDLLVPYLFPKAGAAVRRWITHLPARLCRLTVVTNEGDRLALAARGLSSHKSPIGSNIATRSFSPKKRRAWRRSRDYTEEELLVGYFGFLNRSKGGLTLVRTLHELVAHGVPARLLMIGERVGASDPTNYAYLQEVEAEIEKLGLGPRVAWTGRLADAQVSAALDACDVLLMPYTDGVSLRRGTLMAGLTHGCAIVTTFPQSPLPELQDGIHLCYVAPDDPAAAAQAVRAIWTQPALAQRLRREAAQVSRLFTWETIARQHLEFYAGSSP